MFKVNNKNTTATSMTSLWRFIVKFEHISHLFLGFPLLTMDKQMLAVFIINLRYIHHIS